MFGSNFDGELAAQVNDVMNYLMVPRERNSPQPIVGKLKSDGTEYKHLANGELIRSKPDVKIQTEGEQVSIYVSASNDEQFNEVIKGLVRKYPVLNKKEILKQAKRTKYYLDEPMRSTLSVGGPEAFRSLAKTAINYYVFKGGDPRYIKHLIPYLQAKESPNVVWYYFSPDAPFVPKENEVSHIIKLIGSRKYRVLYAYIELFNYMNVVVLLSKDYSGVEMDECYAFELTTQKVFHAIISIDLDRERLLAHFAEMKSYQPNELLTRMNRTMLVADTIQTRFHLNKLIENEVDKAYCDVPQGASIGRDRFNEMIDKLSETMAQFFAHQENRSNIRKGNLEKK